jgi:hypothetical protein
MHYVEQRVFISNNFETMRHEKKMPLRVLKKINNALTVPCEKTTVETEV